MTDKNIENNAAIKNPVDHISQVETVAKDAAQKATEAAKDVSGKAGAAISDIAHSEKAQEAKQVAKDVAGKAGAAISGIVHSEKAQAAKAKFKEFKHKKLAGIVAAVIIIGGGYYGQEQMIQKNYNHVVHTLKSTDGIQVSASHLGFGLFSDKAETTLIINPSKLKGIRDLGGNNLGHFTVKVESDISKLGIFSLNASHHLILAGNAGKAFVHTFSNPQYNGKWTFEVNGDDFDVVDGKELILPVAVESNHSILVLTLLMLLQRKHLWSLITKRSIWPRVKFIT